MNLYKFNLNIYGNVRINREVIKVEEKPKTYKVINGSIYTRINKCDIGVLIQGGYSIILLEDDIEKAREVFISSLQNKIANEKKIIEEKIKSGNKNISDYEKALEDIKKMN